MLTLTRKVGESIRIGDDICIVIREISGKQVRVGIEAPSQVLVYREELYEKIKAENAMASQSKAQTRSVAGDLQQLTDLFKKK